MSWGASVIAKCEAAGEKSGTETGAKRILNDAFHETLIECNAQENRILYSIDEGPSPVSSSEVQHYIGNLHPIPVTSDNSTFVEWGSSWESARVVRRQKNRRTPLEPEFWLERWEKHEIGFHQEHINSHLKAYWQTLNLAAGQPVFVPLCGKSLDMLWLPGQGHKVLGVEISPIAVNDFFNENGLTPQITRQDRFDRFECGELTLLLGDFFDLNSDDLSGISAVFDRASLIALPSTMRQVYAQHLTSILPKKTGILLVTLEYEQTTMEGPPFSVLEDEVRQLYQRDYGINPLFEQDVLDIYPRFHDRGLNALREKVFLLTPGSLSS